MQINEGRKRIGRFFNSDVYIDLAYLFKNNGKKKEKATYDKVIGKLLFVISLVLLIIPILLLVINGSFSFQNLFNPTNIIYFIPYLSIFTFLYSRFLLRDRREFDDDLNRVIYFKDLKNSEINIEKYLDVEILYYLDDLVDKKESFLYDFCQEIFNNPQNAFLLENRLGLNRLKLLENLPSYLSNKIVSFDFVHSELFYWSLITAYEIERTQIDSTVILLVILKKYIKGLVLDMGVTDLEIEGLEQWLKNENRKKAYFEIWKILSRVKPTGNINRSYTSKQTPVLNSLSTDLTANAANGDFMMSLGRDSEIIQITNTLQKTMGNASIMILGEPGVGKSRLIKFLATKMVVEDVPQGIQDYRLVSVDLGKVLTQSGHIDIFKNSLQKIFKEIKDSGSIILVLEDFAQLLTIRDDSKFEVVNLIINNINGMNLKVIATSNTDDFNKYIRPIKSLSSLFDVVLMNEPSSAVSLQILIDEVDRLEKKYNLSIQVNSLRRIVEFAPRFNYERVMPDKGIDLLEECCLKARSENQKYVDNRIVETLLTEKTGMKVGTITEDESETLKNLEKKLHERVVGQDEAIKSISLAIRRSRSGLASTNRPIASFLFFGPTGVGKTELAKTLADVYYGDEKLMIRLDMSEYQEEKNLERLLGYTDNKGNFIGGYLSEPVRSKPYSLILLDEVEKANKKVLDLFLQVLDDGFLTDGMGKKVDFTNTIIIMTSNIASKEIANLSSKGEKYNDIYKVVSELIRNEFRIEFINRFDKVIMFKTLTRFEIKEIVEIMLNKIKDSLLNRGMFISWNNDTVEELTKKSYSLVYGAREIRRIIQEEIEDKLAMKIIEGELKSGADLKFDGLEIKN